MNSAYVIAPDLIPARFRLFDSAKIFRIVRMSQATVEKKFQLSFGGHELWLLPSGCVYWPERRALFAADLHLGKTTTFRRSGIPVPSGASEQTVAKLCKITEALAVKQLILLGDLVHAQSSWDLELDGCMQVFASQQTKYEVILVEGNHDRGSMKRWSEYSIKLVTPPYAFYDFVLVHDEELERPTAASEAVYFMAGHRHPSVRCGESARSSERLKCFCIQNNCLTLPAFGEFTGGKNIQWGKRDRVFAIAGDEILQISIA